MSPRHDADNKTGTAKRMAKVEVAPNGPND
jgi:hypothetical protein